MVNVLFTATRAASESDAECTAFAVGNDAEQFLEFQRSDGQLRVELALPEGHSLDRDAIESVTLNPKRIELQLTEQASASIGTVQRLHIPLRLTSAEAELVRHSLREITADLIAFEEALRQ